MTVLAMSHGELSRFDTSMPGMASITRPSYGFEARQFFRLLDRMRTNGAEGLVSRKLGRPSNRRHSDKFRDRVVSLVCEHYPDFGPTLAR